MPFANVLVVAPLETWDRLQRNLEDEPCTVMHTDRPTQALRLVAEHHIDIVITDATFPGHLSIELLSLLSRLHPSVFRVLLTPFDDLQAALRALNEGHAQRFLLDGGSPEHLRHVLAEGSFQAARRQIRSSPSAFIH